MNSGVMKLYKISRKLYLKKLEILAKCLKTIIRVIYGATIPYKADIGDGTKFPHGGIGVVIHEDAIIGKNCIIQANAVIGGRNGLNGAPKIGDNTLIGAGAVIMGKIEIGENVSVGANAVVIRDIPANSVAVGVPAKVISRRDVENK